MLIYGLISVLPTAATGVPERELAHVAGGCAVQNRGRRIHYNQQRPHSEQGTPSGFAEKSAVIRYMQPD